jgi:hypothetical protein
VWNERKDSIGMVVMVTALTGSEEAMREWASMLGRKDRQKLNRTTKDAMERHIQERNRRRKQTTRANGADTQTSSNWCYNYVDVRRKWPNYCA